MENQNSHVYVIDVYIPVLGKRASEEQTRLGSPWVYKSDSPPLPLISETCYILLITSSLDS